MRNVCIHMHTYWFLWNFSLLFWFGGREGRWGKCFNYSFGNRYTHLWWAVPNQHPQNKDTYAGNSMKWLPTTAWNYCLIYSLSDVFPLRLACLYEIYALNLFFPQNNVFHVILTTNSAQHRIRQPHCWDDATKEKVHVKKVPSTVSFSSPCLASREHILLVWKWCTALSLYPGSGLCQSASPCGTSRAIPWPGQTMTCPQH